jgi:dephospho-CoA kinase
MLVIGLTGGVASGKSLVAACFQRLGAPVLDADLIGHRVLQQPATAARIGRIWPEVLDAQGTVDRQKLGFLVFHTTEAADNLQKLERIVHPLIAQEVSEKLQQFRLEGQPAVILDAPVMIKAGWHHQCDKLIFVESSLENRISRARMRGWTAEELLSREKSQTDLQLKKSLATDVIDNNCDIATLESRVRALWQKWGLKVLD